MSHHAITLQRCFATNNGDASLTRPDSIPLSSAILSPSRAIGLMLIAVAATSVAPRDCLGLDVNWAQPAFGQYRSLASWSPSVEPDETTNVYFGKTIGTTVAEETVLFITDAAANYATVVSGNYTFQFANTEIFGDDRPPYLAYRTSGLVVGSAVREVTLSSTAMLTVNIDPLGHPGKIESKDIDIGPPIGADETARPGTLILDGPGVTLEVTPADISDEGDRWRTTIIGGGGNSGRLEVRNGAKFITPPQLDVYNDDGTYGGNYPSYVGLAGQSSFGAGSPQSGDGEMLVTGIGSLVDAKGGLWIANNGTANVEVRDGGRIKTPFIQFGSVYWDGRGGIGPIEGIGRLIVSGAGMDIFQQPIRSYLRTRSIDFYDPHSAIEVHGEGGVLIAADDAVNIFHPNGSVYLDKTGDFNGTGTIIGNFIIGKDAVYSPGSSPGTLTVEGDFEMEEGARLTLEVGGSMPQIGYDQILVDGDVTLRGFVDIRFINNFQPHLGDVFNLLSAGGAFSDDLATIRVINAPSGFTFATLTTPQGIGLTVVPEPSTLPLAAVSLGCACFIVRRRRSCIASATAATEVPERRSRSRRHSVFDVRNRPNGRPNTPTADFNVLSCLRNTLTQPAGRVLVSVFIVVLGDSISNGQVINLEDDPLFEAKTLALEFSGELRPPTSLVSQFDHDLNLIRQIFPQVADIYALPTIVPGEIFVGFTAEGDQAFQNGTFSGFDSLFTELGTPTVRHDPTLPFIFLSFGAFYHSVRLAEMFAPIEGVRYAEPNIYGYCCGELVDIVASDGRSYLFSRGPAEYEFSVSERTITLWRQPGSSEPVVVDLVPEPSTLLLAALSLACTGCVARRRRSGAQFRATECAVSACHFAAVVESEGTPMNSRMLLAIALSFLGCATSYGQTANVYDDPQFEAKSLALEISGQLLPPTDLTNQIDRDLRLIRTYFPQVADIGGAANWVPGDVIVGLTAEADADLQNGLFTGFDPLYAALGTPSVRHDAYLPVVFLSFGEFYHPDRLDEMFQSVDGVRYAEPNGFALIGSDIIARADRSYTFSRQDSYPSSGLPVGLYEFSVSDRTITLWRQPGSDIPVVVELVPEPGTLVLASTACLLALIRRKHQLPYPPHRGRARFVLPDVATF